MPITCTVDTHTDQTTLAFALDDDDSLAIEMHANGSSTTLRLEPAATVILAAFLKHPAVVEQIAPATLRSLELHSPRLDMSIRAPLQLFANL